MTHIRSFAEIGAQDVGVAGGKGANLGEMTRAGLPVPPGFVVLAEGYREYLHAIAAHDLIAQELAGLDPENLEQVERRTAHIREFLSAGPTPPELAAGIIERYHHLAHEMDETPPDRLRVAVRSSATAEDLPTASFAGQQDTYLNVMGDGALLQQVRRCWASLWTARAVTYRTRQGFSHEQVALAVVVQAMVNSEVSGILFTANPVTGRRDEVVVNASWGLGEAIVSGQVTPDTYVVRKRDGAIIEREIADKDRAVVYDPAGGTVEQEVSPEQRTRPALTDAELAGLGALAVRIEEHYRAPMDIEWARARGHFYILQARAITTLDKPAGGGAGDRLPPGELNRRMFVEIFPDPLSPAFLSVIVPLFKTMLDFTFVTLGFKPPKGMEAIGVFRNQPYFSREYIAAAFQPLSPTLRETLVAQIVHPFGRLERRLLGEWSPAFAGMVLRLILFMRRFPSLLPKIEGEYRRELAQAAAISLENTSDRELVERMHNLVYGKASELLNFDFLVIALIGITYQMLGTLLERYFTEGSEEIRSRLISGVTGNVTMETNQRIWDLAQIARGSPEVAAALQRSSVAELREELQASSDGRAFLAALDQFLEEYGHREVRMDALYPTWVEDPMPVLAFVRRYLEVGESSSPYRQQERLVRERQELTAEVKRRLERDALGRFVILPLFNYVLAETQRHTRERDTVHFELTRLFPPFRRLLLELGRRWTVAGLMERPEDVFFLSLDEMGQLAERPKPSQAKVAARRREFEESERMPAPPILRDGRPVESEQPTAEAAAEGEWRGIAGSPGRATGAARVIRGPDEFDKLKNGDILIAPLTNPVWTPLFAIAGGLVTEVGGILSHGAIVAREYGIPAVMAVPGATRAFQEGQRVTVDGSKGIVSLE